MGGQRGTANQQSGTWRAKKNNRHGEAWDEDKGCWTSHWLEKLHVCSHQNRDQDFSFPSTVSSYLLITRAKISTFLQTFGPWGSIILKDISLRLPTNHCYLSLRDLQGGSTGSTCASCLLRGVSLIVHSGIHFCCLFLKQLGKPHAKHLSWKILSVKGNKCPTTRGCQNSSLMWSLNSHALCLHNLMPSLMTCWYRLITTHLNVSWCKAIQFQRNKMFTLQLCIWPIISCDIIQNLKPKPTGNYLKLECA